MIVVPYTPDLARSMDVQRAQLGEAAAESLDAAGPAWAAIADGEVIACAGLVPVWEGRAYAWALLARGAGRHMLRLTRQIRSRLDAAGYRRVEMAVDSGFGAGCRWATLLGFRLETPFPMQGYLPNGKAAYLYARN